jgi:hypothetical protein
MPTPSNPRQTPSLSVRPPSKRRFPHPNSGRSATAVHSLGEPPTELFPHQSRSHLTSLSPSPWCRARAPSSVTTVPAPPQTTTTMLRRAIPLPPPPMCRRLGEPRHRSSCPVPPQDPTGAHRQHLAAGQPPPRCHRAHHRAGTHGDRTVSTHGARPVSARHGPPPQLGWAARSRPSRPSGRPCMAGRQAEHRRPWAKCGARHCAAIFIVFQLF